MNKFVFGIILVALFAALLPAKSRKRSTSKFSNKQYEVKEVQQFVNMREMEVRHKKMGKTIEELQKSVTDLTSQLEKQNKKQAVMEKKMWKVDFITKSIKKYSRWAILFLLLIILIPAIREFTVFKTVKQMKTIVDELNTNPPVRIKSGGSQGGGSEPIIEGGPDSKLSL